MGKRSQRRPARYETDQLGCMWALISIFDFRLSKTTRRLLSDKKRGSRQSVGAGSSRSGLNLLTNFDENCLGIDDGKESKTLTADFGKTSVKKLIEEEMFSEQHMKKEITSAEVEELRCDMEHGAHLPKTRKQTKTCKRTCDIQLCDLKDAASLEPQQSSLPNSVEQSSNSLDLAADIEQFCSQIHQCHEIGLHHENGKDFSDVRKIISCVKHDQLDEINSQPDHTHFVLQEKLGEEIEAFINKKFTDGKHLTSDGAIHQSNQFMDALEMLNSNKELFLKLLQDPNSHLVKHIQDLRDAQAKKDEPTKSFAGANLSEEDISNSRQCEELACRKQFHKHKMHSFFRRNIKSQERNPSRGSDNPQASNRMVVLKPGIAGMQNSETETSSLSSSPISHYSLRNNGQSVRATSQFSFREIKRKLKHAIGETRKEPHWISMDGKLHTIPYDSRGSGDSGNGIAGEILGRDSLSKTFVDIERTAKTSISVKSRDKLGKPKDSRPSIGHDIASNSVDDHKNIYMTTLADSKQREPNIYTKAKKHLSEILSTGDVDGDGDGDEDLSSRRVPRTLGRLLSLPEYNLSPIFSPERDREHRFVTAQTRVFPFGNFQGVNENMWRLKKENNASRLSPLRQNLEAPPCIGVYKPDDELQSLDSNSDILKELLSDTKIHESISSSVDESSPEAGDVEIVETTNSVCPEESNLLDVSSGPNSTLITNTNLTTDVAKICEEKGYAECSRPDSPEVNQPPSSSVDIFLSSSLINQKFEELGSINDVPEQPSPVSVLEPFFIEDVISPASTISQPAELPMQPLRIHFGDHNSSALLVAPSDSEIYLRPCMEDKKSTFEYVRSVLQASALSWDELLGRWHSSHQLLDPSLFDEVEVLSSHFCCDQRLLFDCVNEVLIELYEHYFGCSPWVTFVKPNIRPVPVGENFAREVWEGIDWHLLSHLPPWTLDQIIEKDVAKSGMWMDLRFDSDGIGNDIGEAILEEMMEDTIFELYA